MSYQGLTFNGVVYREGVNRMPEYRNIFPFPPIGKTVLDVGCNAGFYVIQARLDGAKFCLGLDRAEGAISEGNAIVGKLGLDGVWLVRQDVTEAIDLGRFDVVLCLNLLHHFKEDGIRKILMLMDEAATEKIVLGFPPLLEGEGLIGRVRTKGAWFTGISIQFIKSVFPDYVIGIKKSLAPPGDRILVDVRKK